MVQGWTKFLLGGLSVLLIAACDPLPHGFDNIPAEDGTRPPALQSGYPYPLPPFGERDYTGVDPYSVLPEKIVKVGLLVPLSGRSEAIGNALRDAAVLALFDKYATVTGQQAAIRVELVTKDTQGSPEGARQAAAEAVKEGAQLIIGPLFGRSVEAIKPLAQTGKVSILSFSNNKEVAGKGVYVMGFDPNEQATRVANYTFRQDMNNVAVLAPNDAYGRQVIKSFKRVGDILGRNVKPVIRYSHTGSTLNDDLRTLSREGTVGARFAFSGLFLPEGGNKLGPILGGLKAMNITPQTVQFIGTGLWDDRDLIRQHDLSGAWLASSPPRLYEAFEQRYRNTYNKKPPRLASLAYDAVALAATLATNNQGFGFRQLTSPGGFSGPANGIFRFRKDGSIERGLAVLRVNGQQGFEVIDPAPTSFR